MPSRSDGYLNTRVTAQTLAGFERITREFRLSKKDGVAVLVNAWQNLTDEQRLAAIRGGAVHDPAATYHDPNNNQEETDPIGDSVLSPARA